MDSAANPYRAGPGRRPPTFAGRTELMAAVDVAVRRAQEWGEGERPFVVTGLHGTGRSALLDEARARVASARWLTARVDVEAGVPLPAALAPALVRALRTASGQHPAPPLRRVIGVLAAFCDRGAGRGSGAGSAALADLDAEPVRGVADTGEPGADLAALCAELGLAARELGVGVLIGLDGLHRAGPDDLAALEVAVRHLTRHAVPPPVLLLATGMPSLADRLPAHPREAAAYAHHHLGPLGRGAAIEALMAPAARRGATWTPQALALAVAAAHGYPYLLQAIGHHVWEHARRSPISEADAHLGVAAARTQVDHDLYRPRWERATTAQRRLLRALADVGGGGPAEIAAVAAAMGRARVSDLSVARTELLRQGVVHPPRRGQLAFSVPGMHDFVGRQQAPAAR